MCGLAGILQLESDAPLTAEPLRAMAAALVHRGPDDEAIYLDPRGRCGLAFRRLSIIDLAGGRQPISNEAGDVWAAFNGEIYNFRELRQELQAAGHRFRTQSDSEVIVHLFEQLGAAGFAKLDGMFAIALWDERDGVLHLVRDRLGKKPLVYSRHAGRLYFASELKALRAIPAMPAELDPQALHEYLLFQYVPAPHCIYRGCSKLPPATRWGLRACEPPRAVPEPYWSLPHPAGRDAPPSGAAYIEAKRELTDLLTGAVERRLISDVPLGAFLSGGVDSSIVVGLMRRLGVSPLRTFSIGFREAAYDESAHARRVAEHFETEHHEQIVTPQAREVLDTLAYHYDEPFGDSSAIPTYYVARYTRQFVTVALTGDGGDECFGGYDRYRAMILAGRLDLLPRALRRALAVVGGRLPHARPRTLGHKAYRFLTALGQSPARRYLSWMNVFTPERLLAGYRREFRERVDFEAPLRWFHELFDRPAVDAARRANYADILSYLPGDLLVKVDIASMACGLECRSPLLDRRLVEFGMRLPRSWVIDGAGKRILKDVARDLLPRETLARRKMGFGVPVGRWFRGELRELLRDALLSRDSLSGRVFRPEWLQRMTDEHIAGRANFEHPLWVLLMLELWNRRWRPGGV